MDSFRVRKRPYEHSPLSSAKKPRREGGLRATQIDASQDIGTPKKYAYGPGNADASPGPHTPRGLAASLAGSEKPIGASAVKKVAASTPQKLKAVIQKLPSSYALLADMFGKLQTVYLLYKSRGQRCTFQNCKRPIEESCGRLFTVKHLMQLKEVFPEALQLSYAVVARGQTPGGSSRGDMQLMIDMPLTSRASSSATSTQDLRQELADRLLARLRVHYREHYGQTQPANAGLDDPVAWDPAFDLSRVPEIPQAAPPPIPSAPGSPACASPSIASPATPATGAPGPTPRSTARKPPTVPRTARPMAKRLSFGGPGAAAPAERPAGGAALESGGLVTLDEEGTHDDAGDALGARLRRESVDGLLPVSLHALQAVREHNAENDALFSSDAVARRQRDSALAMLSKTFDAVRSAFGASGPNVQSEQQVLQALLSSRVCGTQPEDVQAQMALLAESVPEYLTKETRMGQGVILRINRKANLKAVREKIQRLGVPS